MKHSGGKRPKRKRKNQQSLNGLWKIKKTNIHVSGVPEESEKQKYVKK